MEKKEIVEKLKEITRKEISLSEASRILGINEFEVFGFIRDLRLEGVTIITQQKGNDIYMFNHGERDFNDSNTYQFYTDQDNEFKFVVISDTRFGSKFEQLSILNDIYLKAYEQGYRNVILCGNISEGLYKLTNVYSESSFLNDTMAQVDYITQYYPMIEGMNTYFITGYKDETHLKANRIDIGRKISEARSDMIYLGCSACNIKVDKANMFVLNPKLVKTYTVSYRMQQQVDSFRSEDKPDMVLFGGLLQMEKFTYRNVKCISVPSVCATTREMSDKRYSNTVGAWLVTLHTNKLGALKELKAMESVYYKTNKDDYIRPKILRMRDFKKEGE